jgi:hypothetical protein
LAFVLLVSHIDAVDQVRENPIVPRRKVELSVQSSVFSSVWCDGGEASHKARRAHILIETTRLAHGLGTALARTSIIRADGGDS